MASTEEAQNLASYIRIGSLSLELTELRSSVVAAQLGEEAIATSVKAGAIPGPLYNFNADHTECL